MSVQLALMGRAARGEHCQPACSVSCGCSEAPGRSVSRRDSFVLGVKGTSPGEDFLSWYGLQGWVPCPMESLNSTWRW